MAHFEDKSPPAEILTEWGAWSQTRDDLTIEVHLPAMSSSKVISIALSNRNIHCSASGKVFFEGELFNFIHADESTWSLEDGTMIRIFLSKAKGGEIWPSILANGQYAATPVNMEEMVRHNDLESFQAQYPGMDFSRAKLQKTYD